MATTGLKRPSDFELNHNGLDASNSPNWPVTNANKRLCLNNFVAQNHYQNLQQQQQQQQNMYSSNQSNNNPIITNEGQLLSTTPFKYPLATMNPLSNDVNSMIKNEFHRANNHIHNNNNNANNNNHCDNAISTHPSTSNSNNSTNQNINANANNQNTNSTEHDAPVLSIRQTQLICEKIIRERELRLREEYDMILINKLSEQYDTFVKYTHDHIEKRYNESNSHQASYLS